MQPTFKILYVEDNPTNMLLIREMFGYTTNYTLLEAETGHSGFDLALQAQPDLILLDVHLPDITGVALIEQIKQTPALQPIPIIAVTGDTNEELQQLCLAAGALQVLYKPFSRFVLLDIIRRYTDARNVMVSPNPIEQPNDALLKKVLIVDDNPDLRTIFARTFDPLYFDVHVASDGMEALEHLQADLPDVLILDINMPRLSGFDVLRQVRANQTTKDVKVVVVTGNVTAMQAPEAEYADLLLIKPVNINELVTLAQRLIN